MDAWGTMCEHVEAWDPGYEYPPERECFTKYKRNGNDDVENGDDDDDDDDDFNESKSDRKNNKIHRRNSEMGAKFHIKTGKDSL